MHSSKSFLITAFVVLLGSGEGGRWFGLDVLPELEFDIPLGTGVGDVGRLDGSKVFDAIHSLTSSLFHEDL
jgi:hypothetical protein